jgi:hypothetical protein
MPFRAVQRLILSAILFNTIQGYLTPAAAQQASGPSDSVKLDSVKLDSAKLDTTGAALESETTTGAATTGGGTVKGTVADPDSAVIPGATVTLTPLAKGGKALVAKSGGDGSYSFQNVPAGTYSETVTMPGFASFVKLGVKIAAGDALTIDAKMAIQSQNQQVNVTANGTTLSTDSDSNASATVIKGKDLEALSDDPDELSSELTALAGPAAGPNGGQIYVDGFTGGQLPPKSSIREIRINQNPFSAQYDRVGYGRVEVFTKPGADKFHGFFQTNGNANFLNTSNPFLGPVQQQPYHTIFVFGSLTGPISKKASFSLGGSHRDIQENTQFTGSLYSESPTATTPCAPGSGLGDPNLNCAVYPITIPVAFPQVRTDFTPRIDYQLAEKNTLTVRYQYAVNSQHNDGIGQFDLPSTGYNLDATDNEIQMTDSQIISAKMVNETRFEYERSKSAQDPLTKAATVSVPDAFTAGGSATQTVNDHQDHFEVQNYSSLALAKNFIRFGGRLRTTRDANYSNSQSLGIFNYGCLVPTATCSDAYSTGTPEQYVVAHIAQPSIHATLADLGLYAEDDWKVKPNFTVTYGLRYETQSHIRDHHDFAPRVSFAYGLGPNKTSPQTVVRGGFGVFYDRFSLTNVITTEQENGTNQTIFKIPGSSLTAGCTPTNQTDCGTGTAATQTTYALSPSLRSSYTMQAAIGLDEQLGKIGTVSVNYITSRGVHEFNSEDLTAGGTSNTYQFASNGVFRQNQLAISPRINYSRSISLWGYYSLSKANADSMGSGYFPSVANNLGADYGRASFDVRNQLYMGGTFSAPYRISISPFMAATSGHPFNIVTTNDLNGDGILSNDRPAFCTSSSVNTVQTSHGCFDIAPATGTARIPVNYGTGPAAFALNVRVTRTFGFGPDSGTKAVASSNTPPPGGPPGGGRGGPGGGGGRGGGGPFGGGGGSSGKRFSLNVGVYALNIFNDVDRATPNGVVGSPNFYQSTSLAGGAFTSGTAVRRINLTATFSF